MNHVGPPAPASLGRMNSALCGKWGPCEADPFKCWKMFPPLPRRIMPRGLAGQIRDLWDVSGPHRTYQLSHTRKTINSPLIVKNKSMTRHEPSASCWTFLCLISCIFFVSNLGPHPKIVEQIRWNCIFGVTMISRAQLGGGRECLNTPEFFRDS